MSQQDHARLKYLMKYLGINKTKIAKETRLSYNHVKDYTVPKEFSPWMKFTLWVFDEMEKRIEDLKDKDTMIYDFEAKDIYTGTAPPIKYDKDSAKGYTEESKPKNEKK